MGTNLMRALLLTSASVAMVATAAPTVAYAQEATYQIDIPAQSMGDALRALGKATKQNIVFNGSLVKGKRSAAVRGRMSASEALDRMLQGSGLKMSRGAGGGLVVAQGGNADAAPARTEASAISSNVVAVPSASASTVVDARTGAALKGALIEIVETGEKTSTGDLGEFRFPGKNGSFNLRISYLGYPEYQQYVDLKDGRATSGILLSDGSAVGEIVVTAYQSARAQALNQERTALNSSTVISDDLMGQFDGTTISDALRRAPGVTFRRDPLTGDGTNINVRGLEAGFNTVTLNGVRVPVGDGASRSPSLNNILADSISKITINKTLLPSQDGTGTGALVDIETKGPLDRPNRYFNLGIEHAKSAKSFLDETNVSGTASMRMGRDSNFGISASVQYRKRSITRIVLNAPGFIYGQYLPATDDGRAVTGYDTIDPRRLFPFEPGVDEIYPSGLTINEASTDVENLSFGGSAQWDIGNHTKLRLDANRLKVTTEGLVRSGSLTPQAGLRSLPIPELNGEQRLAYIWENFSQPGLRLSATVNGSVQAPRTEESTIVSFRGTTATGPFTFDYKLGYTNAKNRDQGSVPISGTLSTRAILSRDELLPEVAANTLNGRIVSPFLPINDQNFALPGLTKAGFDRLATASLYNRGPTSNTQTQGGNTRYTAGLDIKRDFSSNLFKYLKIGAFFEKSTSRLDSYETRALIGPNNLAATGIELTSGSLERIGKGPSVAFVTTESLRAFARAFRSGNVPGYSIEIQPTDELALGDSTEELDFAGYAEAMLTFGKLEIIGGLRYENVRTKADVVSGSFIVDEAGNPDDVFNNANRIIYRDKGSQSTILPRLLANYRLNDNAIIRLGYYRSYARPNISQLNSDRGIVLFLQPVFGPNGDQPMLILSQGNPDLRASSTDNLDISLEWYDDNIGVMKLAAFYKPTKNAFFASTTLVTEEVDLSELPDDPRFATPNLFITNSQPQNDPNPNKVWGVEASLERRFTFLPGALSGLGVFGNFTYTKSSSNYYYYFYPTDETIKYKLPYALQPKYSGTMALTYSKSGLDLSAGYTFQTRGLSRFYEWGLTSYSSPIDSFDVKASYQFKLGGGLFRVFAEGSNLLRGPSDPSGRSAYGGGAVPSAVNNETYFGGRSVRLGLTSSF